MFQDNQCPKRGAFLPWPHSISCGRLSKVHPHFIKNILFTQRVKARIAIIFCNHSANPAMAGLIAFFRVIVLWPQDHKLGLLIRKWFDPPLFRSYDGT